MKTVATKLGPIHVVDNGNADQPTALLWPSLFTDHRMWHHQVKALGAAGWRTLAIDPPGHGRSPGVPRTYTMDECADVAMAVLDAAKVTTPVLFLGTSWGGIVAPRVALRAPERVRGMILFNTTAEAPTLPTKANSGLLTLLLKIPATRRYAHRLIASLVLSEETRRSGSRVKDDLLQGLAALDRRAIVLAVRSVLIDRDAVLGKLSAVQQPSLIVSGEKDTILPTPFAKRMAQALPNARQVEIPAVAHLSPLEAPEVVNALIMDFIARLPVT